MSGNRKPVTASSLRRAALRPFRYRVYLALVLSLSVGVILGAFFGLSVYRSANPVILHRAPSDADKFQVIYRNLELWRQTRDTVCRDDDCQTPTTGD